MQHVFRSVAAFLAIGTVFLSVSCNKRTEVQKLPGEAEANYWPDQRYCNIDSFKLSNGKYYRFNYDYFGNPVSILTNSTSTGDPNWFFYYDDKRRMNKYIRLYDNGVTFETYKKFFYGPDNRVTHDSAYNFGELTNGAPTFWMSSNQTVYFYDSLGRISLTHTTFPQSPGDTLKQAFNYDANGNLIKPGVIYDNRNNIHNTNNWWRLIDKDYSKNNPYRASSYIGYLLPRDIYTTWESNYRYFLDIDLPYASIRYICGN